MLSPGIWTRGARGFDSRRHWNPQILDQTWGRFESSASGEKSTQKVPKKVILLKSTGGVFSIQKFILQIFAIIDDTSDVLGFPK